MWACVCMQFCVGAFMRMCYAMHTSTLLHNQIMPVFISGMINGLGPMEAGSTKDSFRYLTIFYVQAVNYGPSTKCKCIIEKDASTLSISNSYGVCVRVCVQGMMVVWVEHMHF